MTAFDVEELLKKHLAGHMRLTERARTAQLYYRNKNDILRDRSPENQGVCFGGVNPLRSADNRISHNWHNLLVNQKAGYLFTSPPAFDVGDDWRNKAVKKVLGDGFSGVCKDLCIEASNTGVAYLHIWCDEDGRFCFGVVSGMEVIPVYSGSIQKELTGVLRLYEGEADGKKATFYEYWDKECGSFFIKRHKTIEPLNGQAGRNTFYHNFGMVPFIPFKNNNLGTSDLENVKPLIDVYDKIYSGFVNDIEDIQQVIFILTNYGGQDLETFLSDLKRYKTVDMQHSGDGDKSGISTLTIDIPVAARNDLLKLTRKQIFISGQGVDPENEQMAYTSGVALRHAYSLLELKAGLMESEFRTGFGKLVRAILRFLGIDDREVLLEQSYFRSAVQNDLEKAQMISYLRDVTSRETIAKESPLVDDWQRELENLTEKG